MGMAIFCALCLAPVAYVLLVLGGHGAFFSGLFTLALALLQLYLLYRVIRWAANKFKQSSPLPSYPVANHEHSPQLKAKSNSGIDAIEKLASLKERGLLTQEEFEKEKKKVLDQ